MFSRRHSSLWNICPGSTIKEGAKQGVIFISFLSNFILHQRKRRYSCNLQIIHGNLRSVSPDRVAPSKYSETL